MITALLLLTSASATDFRDPKISGSWIAGCDNHRDCTLYTLPVDDDGDGDNLDDGIEIEIARAYHFPKPVSVTLKASVPAQAKSGLAGAVVRVDGRPLAVRLNWRDGTASVDAKDVTRFIGALRSAQILEIVRGKTTLASANVEGLQPLLASIDKLQYRTGTVAALAVPGKKPANYLTIPPLVPQMPVAAPPLSSEPATKLPPDKFAELLLSDPCRNYVDVSEATTPEVHYVRLDKNVTLAIMGSYCGGYNPTTRLFLIDNEGKVRKAVFGPHPMLNPEDDPELPDANWDPQNHQLRTFGRARSLGDCGQMASSAWDGERFVTTEYSSMPECRGSYTYVVTYRRKVKR
jgi:hypothetical protein